MAEYLSVISNDTLSHRALSGSPETLCGHAIVSVVSPGYHPQTDTSTGVPLTCDICETLAGGGSFLKQNVSKIAQVAQSCPYCDGGVDDTGHKCWNCHGTGLSTEESLDPYDPYIADQTGLQPEDLRGTRVAAQTCAACGYLNQRSGGACPSCNYEPPAEVSTTPTDEGPQERYRVVQTSTESRTATNWTRDGQPIEDGLEVVTIDKEQAARTPFLDFARVNISERRECPDYGTTQWLAKIASCDTCDQIKCQSCMEDIGASQFFGMCKKCAGAGSDLTYDVEASDPYPARDLYMHRLMAEDETETDPFFLPYDPN